ncbi:hypothetical protein VTN00DRAFT_459 [Thermoascus crustaceus]|uniref:uncharacterized protein n=1 Tax=Thermoascus crustaceus TaxID=5088 RepID=UPI00374435B8
MTKKKKAPNCLGTKTDDAEGSPASSPSPVASLQPSKSASSSNSSKARTPEPSTSALIICRNKHWRYISSFHGPWLQLPPEVLESLAYSNYVSPRPRAIDPAVFFDLVKIRRLIEEATNLAVRAANGTTSSSLTNALNANNGLLSGGSAAALGLGIGGAGRNTKLSRERKHRMREHATQKLSDAYHLDEIAASVATMQSASALEEVAKLVLQRNEDDVDAKYVHFFHEKIPSRSLAQSTSLRPLDEVIASRPNEGAPFRTRAVTRIFKDDYVGAARDLTEALSICRLYSAQHKDRNMQLESTEETRRRNASTRDSRRDLKVDEKDQPDSLESQLLFHRGGVYLTIACQYINVALDALKVSQREQISVGDLKEVDGNSPTLSPAGKEAYRRWLEARKIVKTHAKRALRDYMSFLSYFEYTPGLPSEVTEEFLRKVSTAASGLTRYPTARSPTSPGFGRTQPDTALKGSNVLVTKDDSGRTTNGVSCEGSSYSSLPPAEIYQVSTLFSALPPANLPPYPAESQAVVPVEKGTSVPLADMDPKMLAKHDRHEAITYHPLLTDALHSLLLCHALIQTSPKELLRHAHMVARLARVCDGYPIFLAPRSPARADWIEVLLRTNNWINLQQSWEALCSPASLSGYAGGEKGKETEEAREQRKHEVMLDALSDDRIQDEETLRAAVRAKGRRTEQPRKNELASGEGIPAARRWAQEDGKEYPLTTDRATAIARWVCEAPIGGGGGEGVGANKKTGSKKAKLRKAALNSNHTRHLEAGLHELSLNGENFIAS